MTDAGSEEKPLMGGRITPGVVRVGDTVRRPQGTHSSFVHKLLQQLEEVGFAGCPRFLGEDGKGREILSFLAGEVPADLNYGRWTDAQLTGAAVLIRRFHDATAGTSLAGSDEVVCHNDLGPCNTVFVADEPRSLIDFDAAAPGSRVRDIAYACWLWLNLGPDGPHPREQARRLRLICASYGLDDLPELIGQLKARQKEETEKYRIAGNFSAADWVNGSLEWLGANERLLVENIGNIGNVGSCPRE